MHRSSLCMYILDGRVVVHSSATAHDTGAPHRVHRGSDRSVIVERIITGMLKIVNTFLFHFSVWLWVELFSSPVIFCLLLDGQKVTGREVECTAQKLNGRGSCVVLWIHLRPCLVRAASEYRCFLGDRVLVLDHDSPTLEEKFKVVTCYVQNARNIKSSSNLGKPLLMKIIADYLTNDYFYYKFICKRFL